MYINQMHLDSSVSRLYLIQAIFCRIFLFPTRIFCPIENFVFCSENIHGVLRIFLLLRIFFLLWQFLSCCENFSFTVRIFMVLWEFFFAVRIFVVLWEFFFCYENCYGVARIFSFSVRIFMMLWGFFFLLPEFLWCCEKLFAVKKFLLLGEFFLKVRHLYSLKDNYSQG